MDLHIFSIYLFLFDLNFPISYTVSRRNLSAGIVYFFIVYVPVSEEFISWTCKYFKIWIFRFTVLLYFHFVSRFILEKLISFTCEKLHIKKNYIFLLFLHLCNINSFIIWTWTFFQNKFFKLFFQFFLLILQYVGETY